MERAMELELVLGITFAAGLFACLLNWPYALAGMLLGLFGARVPYGTLVVPFGALLIAVMSAMFYSSLGLTGQADLRSFVTCALAVFIGGTSVFISLRNLQDRL
jgi:hypothetical protein